MKLSSLTVKQLRYFAKVVEMGSISRAAEALRVAQTALGVQIRGLEDQLGTALLRRHCRGVAPTRAGRYVYERAQAIVAAVDRLPDEVAPLTGTAEREVVLGLTPGPMSEIGADALLQARTRLPDIALTLVENSRDRLIAALRDGSVDYAIAHEVDSDGALRAVPVLRQPVVLAIRAGRGLPPGPVRLADALAFDLAARGDASHLLELVSRSGARDGLSPKVAYRVDSLTVQKKVIRECDAAAIVTADLVAGEAASGVLEVHPIVDPEIEVSLCFAARRADPPRPEDRPLLALLDDLLGRFGAAAGAGGRRLAGLAGMAQ
jgi:LysR family nitrogen assimilation transcriptional regulator